MSRTIVLPAAPELWQRLRVLQHEHKVDLVLISGVFDRLVGYAGTQVTAGRIDRAIWQPVKQFGDATYRGDQTVFGIWMLSIFLKAILDNETDRTRVFDSNRETRRKEERFQQSKQREIERRATRKGRGKHRRQEPRRATKPKAPDNVVSLDKHRAKRRTPPGTRSPQPPKPRRKQKKDDIDSGD